MSFCQKKQKATWPVGVFSCAAGCLALALLQALSASGGATTVDSGCQTSSAGQIEGLGKRLLQLEDSYMAKVPYAELLLTLISLQSFFILCCLLVERGPSQQALLRSHMLRWQCCSRQTSQAVCGVHSCCFSKLDCSLVCRLPRSRALYQE